MAQPTIQTSFASGEWAPKLRARVDIQKYKSGAALLRNFYVDYSGGGASTRQGTKFINQCVSLGARLIPFQPSTTLSYVLEFGQNYIRFYSNGAPIVEAATTISGITQANPGSVTDVAHGYNTGDWVLITGVVGMTQVNGNYYIVVVTGANTFTLTDLNGNAINTTTFGAYVSGGTAQRVYTVTSPFLASDLFPNPLTGNPGIKFVQDVTSMIICHPSYNPQILTITAPTNWSLTTITFGSTIGSPTGVSVATTLAAGSVNYLYSVTAVDINGQESPVGVPGLLASKVDLRLTSNPGTNTISWTPVAGAISYNVYKAEVSYTTIPSGTQVGFIGNSTGTAFIDSNINPDFSQGPPLTANPFLGSSVILLTLTANANYTTVPSVTIDPPTSGIQATAFASLATLGPTGISHGFGGADIEITAAFGNPTGNNITFPNGVVCQITSAIFVSGGTISLWQIASLALINGGSITSGAAPATMTPASYTGPGFQAFVVGFSVNFSWQIGPGGLVLIQGGSGYTSIPNVTFAPSGATATATLSGSSGGGGGIPNPINHPGVPGFLQERLMLANQTQAVQSYNLSQPGSFFNFNVSDPSEDDDAISGSIIAEELNDIRNLTPVPTGMIAFTGKGAWLINGGGGISTQTPITPSNQTAQPQGFNGANDMRPIKINMDALYVTNKGNYVRDLTYNLYAQIFTGSDISVFSNHLFFNYYLLDWAWSEEPFKTLWAIRSDGMALSLAFVKDQEVIGWAHHDTNGQFKSVCSVIENVNGNIVDAVYFIVQRQVNGNVVQYVERMADRYFTYGYEDAWSVDCALQTTPVQSSTTGQTITFAAASGIGVLANFSPNIGLNAGSIGQVIRAGGGVAMITAVNSGSQAVCTITQPITYINPYTNVPFASNIWTIWNPVSSVGGLTQLIGQQVVGVADGTPVGPFTVSATGTVALGLTASKVTLGLAYLPQLQTLPLDLGENPTVQGKRKKITGITVRAADTLGISIGKNFSTVVPMKDFILGNVPTSSTGPAKVTGLVNGDGRTIIDQEWDEAGDYCIQQNLPYPATILGVMPEVALGDTK